MGRKKGYKMSKAQKKAISKGQRKRREEMKIQANGNSKNFFGALFSILKRN